MKLTAITNQKGEILATFKGHPKDFFQFGDLRAFPEASKDQVHHELNLSDDLEHVKPEELHKNVAAQLKKK